MKKTVWIVLLFILLVVLILLLSRCNQSEINGTLPIDSNAQVWEGNQNLHKPSDTKEIAIPGFTHLSFLADSIEQQVNFYNPANNDCLFVFSLYVDNTLLWRSGYCPAGNGYYSIQLLESLQRGHYNAVLKIECYRENGEQLNGARIPFDLTVEE